MIYLRLFVRSKGLLNKGLSTQLRSGQASSSYPRQKQPLTT